MARTIAYIVIMLVSGFAGFLAGSAINGSDTFCILFAVIAGFACTIHAIESKKNN